ncbi:hypothetical protein ACKKBG_A38720 [Auxenochlorella protothecoides x Auxenochlorella symbiontica]
MRTAASMRDVAGGWIEEHMAKGHVTGWRSLGGSGWSSAMQATTSQGAKYFVKTSGSNAAEMFQGEALGLQAMYATKTLRVPAVHHWGDGPEAMGSFIIMEFIERAGPVDQGQLGVNLAAMHEATPMDEKAAAGFFGFAVDNSIGGTPQRNTWTRSWPEFFREHRLRPQVEASGSAELQRMAEPLLESLDRLFAGVTPRPALLHGDLWSGNVAGSREGPVVFDPATYYGHAEAEFGMVWCSGFGRDFWEGYHAVLPRDPGWEGRQELYTLYHKLNHYNLFGSGYMSDCKQLLSSLARRVAG